MQPSCLLTEYNQEQNTKEENRESERDEDDDDDGGGECVVKLKTKCNIGSISRFTNNTTMAEERMNSKDRNQWNQAQSNSNSKHI